MGKYYQWKRRIASYKQDHNNDLYRRGLYTFIKLTAPPPSMMIFDASNRDQCEAKRSSTNTPLQALNMLNDPTILEASRVMAQKISMGNENLEEKIEKAFESIVIRPATRFEKNKLIKYCESQLAVYQQKPALTKETLAVGEFAQPSRKYNEAEAAALMKTILIMYNLEEAITKS